MFFVKFLWNCLICRTTTEKLEGGISSLRLIKYEILLFNNIFSTVVYLTKVIAISVGIVGGFGFLKLLNKTPVLALIFGNVFIVAILVFPITFNGTHQITEKVEELKREILVKSRKVRTRNGIKEVEKILKSVQRLGIKVGGFNYMERESTLIFLQYVLEQIVSLLLMF